MLRESILAKLLTGAILPIVLIFVASVSEIGDWDITTCSWFDPVKQKGATEVRNLTGKSAEAAKNTTTSFKK